MQYNGTFIWVQNGAEIKVGTLDEYGKAIRDSVLNQDGFGMGPLHEVSLGFEADGSLVSFTVAPANVRSETTYHEFDDGATVVLRTDDGLETSFLVEPR